MIITVYGLIVFLPVVWIGVITVKSRKAADEKYGVDMLGFAYPAIPSRHEVPEKTLPAIYVPKTRQTHGTI